MNGRPTDTKRSLNHKPLAPLTVNAIIVVNAVYFCEIFLKVMKIKNDCMIDCFA